MGKESITDRRPPARLPWLDVVRGVALAWIFLVHFVERFMPAPLFANPGMQWGTFSQRIGQLAPLQVDGLAGIFVNGLRYLGWLGDQGVQIFLVAGGFGLAMSAFRRGSAFRAGEFYRRRFLRILPQWWMIHLLFIATAVIVGTGLSIRSWQTLASFFGLRFLPQVFYYFAPAWWFIGLLLQLYLIYPYLHRLLLRWRGWRFLLIVGGAGILVRLAGLLYFEELLDWWSRGAIFVARLPEFAFGMALADFFLHQEQLFRRLTRGLAATSAWIGLYVLGNLLSFNLIGMAFAFLLTGASAFVLLFQIASTLHGVGLFSYIGKRSLELFLVHHPIILYLVPNRIDPDSVGRMSGYLLLAVIVTLVLALGLEWVTRLYTHYITRPEGTTNDLPGRLARFLATIVIVASVGYAAEAAVRLFAPQEVLGWGERPALQPDRTFGYTLKPGIRTRLRWDTYDYFVSANELGFPGPSFPRARTEGALRVFVTGDAFSSAEGVDTEEAWPRLLEKQLGDLGQPAEVLNFSITGWGPNEYENVVARYVPEYQPDIVVVSAFVNELVDVDNSHDDLQQSIGFGRTSPWSLRSFLRMRHLRDALDQKVMPRLKELLTGEPYPYGYFLGQFELFESANRTNLSLAARRVAKRFEAIAEVTRSSGAKLLVMVVPASIQICGRDTLSYYPRHVDILDEGTFNLDQPQELIISEMESLGIEYLDLRAFLDSVECPYQRHNMHWTRDGHIAVAAYLRDEVMRISSSNLEKDRE